MAHGCASCLAETERDAQPSLAVCHETLATLNTLSWQDAARPSAVAKLEHLSVSVKSVISDGLVPVFVWGDIANRELKTNALSTLNEFQFTEILQKEVQDDIVIVFEEETLSVEDFSRRDSNGGTPFPYFQSMISDSVYLPSVDSPLKTLNVIADNDQHLKLTSKGLSGKLDLKPGTYIFISLKDARPDESRSEMLRRHNDFIQKTIADAKKENNNVIGIYTAHFPSWTIEEYHTRVRRQAEPQVDPVYKTDNVLFYVQNITFHAGSTTRNLTNGQFTSFLNGTYLNASITFVNEAIDLLFGLDGGYWSLSTVVLTYNESNNAENTVVLRNSEVYSLENSSFRCGQNLTYENTNGNSRVSFINMQIQPFFRNVSDELKFGEAYHCVGFTSVPIWTGLMIVFIILAITMYGFMMMMDIRTMDRFDDPKGKTIVINAAE
ncbi:V-type proton ATPase subunit S1 [Eumeta japonica]|uniref:V-type proton ATPase subunit S1 n=1 Tax=Eumeta variegata TaxID=151549 RepID=A0A4C1V479_EUMVA|nr:V-type proton ATPase subunit S1 [Eumeta japonica]